MSELRKQLETAKAEYHSMKYPGNIADDLARTRPIRVDRSAWTSGRWRAIGGVAAAAAVALVVFLQVPANTQPAPGGTTTTTNGPVWIGQTAPIVGSVPLLGQPTGSQMVGFNAPSTQPTQPQPTTRPK
jgi:hypothetical protein